MTWLACTLQDVDAANALLPPGIRVAATTDVNGHHWLNADLLTDCAPGQTYAAAQSILESLQQGQPAAFPESE